MFIIRTAIITHDILSVIWTKRERERDRKTEQKTIGRIIVHVKLQVVSSVGRWKYEFFGCRD